MKSFTISWLPSQKIINKSMPFCLTFLFCCYVLNFDIAKILRNARFHAEISLVKESSGKSKKFVTFAVNYQTLASV